MRAMRDHGKAGVQAVLDVIVAQPGRATTAEAFLVQSFATSSAVLAAALPTLGPGAELDPVRRVILKVIEHAQYVRAATQVAAVFRSAGVTKAIRIAAIQTVAALPSNASKEVAREALSDADPDISEAGLAAAIRLKDEKAGEILLVDLEASPVDTWTMSAIEALARLKTRSAVAVFRAAMPRATKETKIAMLRAAKRIGGKDATRFLVETSMAGEAEVSRTASQLLRSR
jgi:hypothetical protein